MTETMSHQTPEDIINAVRPDHESIEWYDGGDNRDVVVVDGTEAFRFPKDAAGVEIGSFEFEAVRLAYGKLHVAVPRPIELARDGSYNVLEFLQGTVLKKHEVAALPYDKRRDIGIALAGVLNDLNANITQQEVLAIPSERPIVRNRDDHYANVYETAGSQDGGYASVYRSQYKRMRSMRPDGSANSIIVFGDLSSPNLVLSEDHQVTGLIDWTELGLGDIHNELRPVFSVIGQEAFDEMVSALDPKLGPVNKDLVRTLAIIHELSVLVAGKQRGSLTPERTQLAIDSLGQWLDASSLADLA